MRSHYSNLEVIELDATCFEIRCKASRQSYGYITRGVVTDSLRYTHTGGWFVLGHEYIVFKSFSKALDALRDYKLGSSLRAAIVPKLQTVDGDITIAQRIKYKSGTPDQLEFKRDARRTSAALHDELEYANKDDGLFKPGGI